MSHATVNTTATSSHAPGTALVTGASSGIGAIYADRLARRGHDLILVARNTDRLREVAQRIQAETGRHVDILSADLGTREGQARVEARLREDARIDTLVNNAGFGAGLCRTRARHDHQHRVDCRHRARAAQWRLRRKQGLRAHAVAIAASRADKGVRVQAVLPGATVTEFWDVAGKPHGELPQEWLMSSQDLVDAALAGLDQGEIVTIPPLQDGAEWTAHEASRRSLSQHLGHGTPGARYGVKRAERVTA